MCKSLIKKIKFRILTHRFEMSPKGEYFARYIIGKYINEDRTDNIEEYERMISMNENRVRKMRAFDAFTLNEDGTENPDRLHFAAANIALVILFISLKESEIQKYINLITNEKAKKFIIELSHI